MLGQGSDARPSRYREHDVAEYLHDLVAGVRLETGYNELATRRWEYTYSEGIVIDPVL